MNKASMRESSMIQLFRSVSPLQWVYFVSTFFEIYPITSTISEISWNNPYQFELFISNCLIGASTQMDFFFFFEVLLL